MVYAFLSFAISLFFLSGFVLLYRKNKPSIVNGFLFSCFLLFFLFSLSIAAILSQQAGLQLLLVGAGIFAGLVVLFGIYVLIALLFWNARIVFQREKRSLANSLTLILAISLSVITVFFYFSSTTNLPTWLRALQGGLTVLLTYYFVHVFLFLMTSVLCHLAYSRKDQDYIVILGSGLIDGEVPPLLAGRINRAIRFYEKQKQTHKPPVLVCSGGQGADESVAEATAMASYAKQRGIPKQDILTETKSVNTFENMKFSKQLMDEHSNYAPYKCIYATSNYHLFRAGIYAKRVGLNMNGIGAKTAWYYLPNALLREYIAYLKMYARQNVIIAGVLFGASSLLLLF